MNRNSVSLRLVPGAAAPEQAADAALPTRIKLLNWGTNDSIYGPVILDETSAATFAENQRRIGRERLPLDFEHNTVEGTPEYLRTQEPRAIAAQGSPVIVRGDGLYLENLTWTETGTKAARDFEDLSPSVFLDAEGRLVGLHSAALTRTGAVHGLTLFSADNAMGAMLATLSAALPAAGIQPTTKIMPESNTGTAPDSQAALIERIALLEATVKQLSAPDAPQLVPLSARIAELETQVKTNSLTADEKERAALLAEASRDGKVIPLSADGLKLVPTAALKELVAKLPKDVVPLSATTKPAESQPPVLTGFAKMQAAISAQIAPVAK